MGKKTLSTGFTGSATRGMSGLDKEVEARMSKRLDVFTDDFSPPGTSESFPGGNFNKRDAPYGKPHDDFAPEADPKFWKKGLHSAGDPADQEKMDWLDQMANSLEAPIKNPYDQFPGDVDMEDHKEIAKFDPHQTDPARLRKMSKIDGPESFNKEVEKRMKKLALDTAGAKVDQDPKPTKDPKWDSGKNPDQEK
jgi:hypothetical protein